jgi:hypothetical protein
MSPEIGDFVMKSPKNKAGTREIRIIFFVFLCSKQRKGLTGNGEIEHNLFEIDDMKSCIIWAESEEKRADSVLLSTGLLK